MADDNAPTPAVSGGQDLSALRDLGVRAASAAAMVVVVGAAIWFGKFSFLALVGLVSLGVYFEWTKLVLGLAKSLPARAIWLVGGLVYIGLAAGGLLTLYAPAVTRGHEGLGSLLAVILAVIAVDVGAFIAGRVIGGPKIAPSISPSKTWAGLIGGMLLATLVLVQFGKTDWRYAAMGPVIAIVAQVGDFFESWMKRRAGVKDSGALLPGHGGLFDRVDGLLAVAFVIQLLFFAFQAGLVG